MSRRAWIATLAAGLVFWALFFGSLWASGAFGRCLSHVCWQRVHDRHAAAWVREHRPWIYRFRRLPARGRHWTHCVSWAESRNHRVTGGRFLSFFQWLLSTWWKAGGRGDPERASWHEQAVRAWRWHLLHPVGQWPLTGEGGRCGS